MEDQPKENPVTPAGPAQPDQSHPTPTQAEASKEAASEIHHGHLRDEFGNIIHGVGFGAKKKVIGFIDFFREQGIIGLAIGFLLGGAVSATVSSFVNNVINPLIGIAIGKVNLSDKVWTVGAATLNYGAFLTSLIDLLIVAAVVYFIFKGLKLDRLDKKKA